MKSISLLTAFILIMLTTLSAQNPGIPPGYKLQLNGSGSENIIRYDLDGDGVKDVFCAVEKGENEDARLMASLKNGKTILMSRPASMCCGSISQKGNVIDVSSKGMRGFTYYKFRWDAAAQDFRLIGYETESFGNAANDGSGKSSLNLLTGDYEAAFNSWNERRQKLVALPKVKRKINAGRKIYLKGFGEDTDEWLSGLTYKYLPKEVQ